MDTRKVRLQILKFQLVVLYCGWTLTNLFMIYVVGAEVRHGGWMGLYGLAMGTLGAVLAAFRPEIAAWWRRRRAPRH